MGQTWFCCKVMLWPWPSREKTNLMLGQWKSSHHGCQTPCHEESKPFWESLKCQVYIFNSNWKMPPDSHYSPPRITSLIRELDRNLVLWKQTALSRSYFKSVQRSLLRRLYQHIFIQAPCARDKRLFILCFRLNEVTLGVGSNP